MLKEFLSQAYKIILCIYSFILTLIWNKKSIDHAKVEQSNNHLKEKVRKIEEKAHTYVNNQRKQAQISASSPHSRDRNELHEWMQEHSTRSRKRYRKY